MSRCKTTDQQPVKLMRSYNMSHSSYQAFYSVISLLVRLHDFPAYVQATNYSPAMKSWLLKKKHKHNVSEMMSKWQHQIADSRSRGAFPKKPIWKPSVWLWEPGPSFSSPTVSLVLFWDAPPQYNLRADKDRLPLHDDREGTFHKITSILGSLLPHVKVSFD